MYKYTYNEPQLTKTKIQNNLKYNGIIASSTIFPASDQNFNDINDSKIKMHTVNTLIINKL